MFIKEVDLFKGLSQTIFNELSDSMVEVSYKQGDFVIKEGNHADHLYILEEGKIRLSVGERGHTTYMVSNSGEAFGWSSLVDRDIYAASAECIGPCKLIKLEKAELNRVFEKNPASGLIFFKRLAGIIGQRLINSYKMFLVTSEREGIPSYG